MAFEYQFTPYNLNSPGYLLCDVPKCVRDEIKTSLTDIECGKIEEIDVRDKLYGHLKKEIQLPFTDNIKYLVESMSVEYENIFYGGCNDKFELKMLWANYAKKYDFFPIHSHTGSYGFVIWVKIPYNLEDELSRYISDSSRASLFCFHYTNTLGKINTLPLKIDKSWEWKMAFFPAELNHSVNPFYTSDEYRISISGNVFKL